MIIGFLGARALMSLSMFLFTVNAMLGTPAKAYLKQKWWLLGLAWVMFYGLSFFWSYDIPYWEERVQTKLAFLVLPLAFGLIPAFSTQQLKWFTYITSLLLFAGCCFSYSFLWRDPQGVLNGYYTSKVMTTPAYGDHISYSIFVAWFIIWCGYIFPYLSGKASKIILTISIIFFIIYLHVLAVKSGLVIFYLAVILYAFYLFSKKNKIVPISIIAGLVALILVAYNTLPSFKHKAGYLKYTYEEYFLRGNMSANFSDMGRVISYKVAWVLIKQNPIIGVGAGDMMEDLKQVYHQQAPSVNDDQILLPHNQIMVVALAGGAICLLLFLAWLFYPLKTIKKSRSGYYMLICWITLLVPLLVDPFLEIQFGVFVYLFCLLWMQKATTTTEPV